jgi:hypothetical protein
MISEPGIFYDMPTAEYFADPAPMPSLTQSLAKILNERSPLHAWHQCPRLNPNFEPDEDTRFDIGNVAHKLILGRGKDYCVLPFDDWRTKAAKEAREAAAAKGVLAVLAHQFDRAHQMMQSARKQLDERGLSHLFRIGNAEVVMAWREHGFWCRQMLDWLIDGHVVLDFKTTDMSVAPHGLGRMMATMGWDVQAAMAERGLSALAVDRPPNKQDLDRRFIFVVQETQEPYCLSVAELPEDTMVMGRKKLNRAMAIWGHCINNNNWPGYPLDIVRLEYPGWAEQQWLEREVHEAAAERMPQKIDPNILMAG